MKLKSERQLLELLLKHGGKVMSANDCTTLQVIEAKEEDRLFTDEYDFSFIHFPPKDTVSKQSV